MNLSLSSKHTAAVLYSHRAADRFAIYGSLADHRLLSCFVWLLRYEDNMKISGRFFFSPRNNQDNFILHSKLVERFPHILLSISNCALVRGKDFFLLLVQNKLGK